MTSKKSLLENEKYLIGNIEWGGFGAMYARRKLIMQISNAFGRTPIFRYKNYVYDDPFKEFDPNLKKIKNLGINEINLFDFKDTEDIALYFDFGKYWGSENMEKYQCWCPVGDSYLLYSGQLYSFLELDDRYIERIDENISFLKKKYELDNFNEVIGLHLRRGDKITETSYISDVFLFDFLDNLNSGNTIFVTSDEMDYIYEIENKYPNYNFIYDSEEKRYGDSMISNVDLVTRNPNLKEQETFTFMKNVQILRHCKFVVGHYSSQLSKIAGSMNSFDKNKDSLYLINPVESKIDYMGSSMHTS